MELLDEIRDDGFPAGGAGVRTRIAARAVLFDKEGLVPLLFVSKHNYHKLPGGGVEPGEEVRNGLLREVWEETGCGMEITAEVGEIVEYRSKANFDWRWDLKQTSYCFIGKVVSREASPNFTYEEINEGFRLVWMPLDSAISALLADRPDNFEGKFIQRRDLAFLNRAKHVLRGFY